MSKMTPINVVHSPLKGLHMPICKAGLLLQHRSNFTWVHFQTSSFANAWIAF